MSKYIKQQFHADKLGGYVFSGSGPDQLMFAQIRGWGQLQYQPDPEKTQDAHLQFLVDALNEKVTRDKCSDADARAVLSQIREHCKRAADRRATHWDSLKGERGSMKEREASAGLHEVVNVNMNILGWIEKVLGPDKE